MNLLHTTQLAVDHWHHDDGHWFPWFPLVPLVFIGLWVVVILTLRGRWGRRWGWQHGWQSGESVLAERFARGEIDEAEYRQRRAALRRKD
jgi:putative membrane protein